MIDVSGAKTTRGTWKLNDNLLHDEVCTSEIRSAISNFVIDHVKDDAPLPVQWEALKNV